ncbi:enoyl-CoA hydratase/isomerase family protein [Pseudoduganella umbonata]|uniref:Enoyl-CoA hydratase/carnithine racemase n=1 Tax=Pseudoduganella umbonata TaxID=864828 RepID=A0A4V1EE15_9BURK|nr:enoyl-CoA hydratase/isomerase family protein [Pseudoduganella umbonata]MBB3222873.1 enoyl-CoA hydratase/carnithine racemase [Pseudoduganella umbonata]QCP13001.1 enoyl-CoA hydratase/isomerase family protein [Pseudoduganella umbonata]
MTDHVHAKVRNGTGFITLDRPKALNSLSLDMIRAITGALLAWRDDDDIAAVVIRSSTDKALCAGGDIRFLHAAGSATPQRGSAQIEDFFTEEYALNYIVHCFPKPYVAVMDGVVMGGGMGIAQGGPQFGVRVVTDRTRLAMPEVNIGLFPDVGGSYFLSRAPGRLGVYLALTASTIGAADALYCGLADHYVPAPELPLLADLVGSTAGAGLREAVAMFSRPLRGEAGASELQAHRALVDDHFAHRSVADIVASLRRDDHPFAQNALAAMARRSPLMMRVTAEMLRRGATMGIADCLRMERNLVRRTFEHGEVIEGVRALAIDKDNAPRWNPPSLDEVSDEMVARFFEPAWPAWAHPLRHL